MPSSEPVDNPGKNRQERIGQIIYNVAGGALSLLAQQSGATREP
ncbi:MAG: hypothetical protein OEN50_08760 [Deltaproteobacteria bacterium]|nr:hypothetical protein [Deltaproteobacteria bacterium]